MLLAWKTSLALAVTARERAAEAAMAPARSPLSKTDPLLRPGLVSEEFSFGTRTHTFYRAPYPTEGPCEAADAAGNRAWVFMYAHFVFRWPEGALVVHVSHGTLNAPGMPLWADVKIAGRWSGPVLAEFGRTWVAGHLAKFAD